MAAKKASLGTILYRALTTAGPWNVPVVALDNIQGPNQSCDLIDATTLDSPNAYDEVVVGVIRGGEVTAVAGFQPDNVAHANLQADLVARAPRGFQIYFPSVIPKRATFSAYVTKWQPQAQVKDMLKAALTLRVTGTIVWS